ncbi:MAG: non-canonical purine NTP diphosphatase [Saprospiraceae bacterium]|nr:non-canonical purine NTP diphosphatase [Saprospiraceae bacterium]
MESKTKIVFATGNPNKLKEVREMLGESVEVLGLTDIGCTEEIPETSPTIEGNAILKAQYVKENYGLDCFSEDTGLEVEALDGQPGVFSARYAGPQKDSSDNMKLVLDKLQDQENRSARFKTVIALIQGSKLETFEGIINGHITINPKGEKGFGYDPIFQPEGYEQTFAELNRTEKNEISHRARAVRKLVKYLQGSNGYT